MVPTTLEWEYALPNGVYDVHVVSADSTNPAMVNNSDLSGTLLHDLDYTTHYGNNSYFEFYTTVYITNGELTLSEEPDLGHLSVSHPYQLHWSLAADHYARPFPASCKARRTTIRIYHFLAARRLSLAWVAPRKSF